MDGDTHRGSLGTVRNATLLLSLLAEGPAYNQLTDLAERSGMSLPTVHRILRSLALAGLVEQDPRSLRYSLGPEVVRLAERYLDRDGPHGRRDRSDQDTVQPLGDRRASGPAPAAPCRGQPTRPGRSPALSRSGGARVAVPIATCVVPRPALRGAHGGHGGW
jgi:DNA-binding transcriptional ArsR family regulator